jgi:hypothetical protein
VRSVAQSLAAPKPSSSRNQSFSMFAEERKTRMPRSKKSAVVEPEVVEQTTDEPQVVDVVEALNWKPEQATDETAETPTEIAETAEVVAQPKTERRCPSHHEFFQDEAEVRPMSEFRFAKTTGKLQQTYCKRCQSKRQSAWSKDHRQDSRGPSLKELVAELEQKLADKDAQLEECEHSIALLEAEVASLRALVPETAE